MHTIIRLPEVKKTTGLSRSTIYKMMMENTFPATISLGAKSVGWLESDIQEWIKSRIEKAK
ncbi:MAG: AlpA family transcriptional regulator [Chitinophagaceae bacterium]|nr:AlpA family transcriptional regulator [Chitinophagaceae bacterium]